mgnify:FL=1|jgi:hypothetical protein
MFLAGPTASSAEAINTNEAVKDMIGTEASKEVF